MNVYYYLYTMSSNYSYNITHLYDHKMLESYFIKASFCLVIIGTVGYLFSNFEMKRPTFFFVEYLPIVEKITKWTPKRQKFENLSTILF